MPIVDLYSRRNQDPSHAESQDRIYDEIPETVRIQIVYIWDESIGRYAPHHGRSYGPKHENNAAWNKLHDTVLREKGLLRLSQHTRDPREACMRYLMDEPNANNVLDIIEMSFRIILNLRKIDRFTARDMGIRQSADDAIRELNFRFKDANLGYQFESGQIIRTDSYATHEKIVKPALHLLNDPRFSGAEAEFLAALKHYRTENYRDSITSANSAIESTLKTIFRIKKWDYDQGDTAGRLLQVARKNGLFPDHMGKSFDQLISTLKSGLIPIRNRESSSHGQGPESKNPPDHVAEYALNLCAVQILFLVKSMK